MKHIFAEHDNKLFIRADYSGIHQLILISDRFVFYSFKGDKFSYLDIHDVLKWHQKELEYGTKRKPPYLKKYLDEYRKMIKIITKAIEDFENEK